MAHRAFEPAHKAFEPAHKTLEPAPKLADLQRWMRWVITDPRGVQGGLVNSEWPLKVPPSRFSEPLPRRLDCIASQGGMERETRLNVYAQAYFLRIEESLQGDFETLCRWLGPDEFRCLLTEYLVAHPSRSTNIGEAGRHLADFIAATHFASNDEFLADLARLEWSAMEAFFAPEVPTLDAAALAKIPPAAWPSATFTLDASVRVFASHWQVDSLWRLRHADDREFRREPTRSELGAILVYRAIDGLKAEFLNGAPLALFRALQAGETLEQITQRVSEATASELEATKVMGSDLNRWMGQGLIRGVNYEL